MNVPFPFLVRAQDPQELRAERFPPTLKLLLLGPHPDDFDAIGVTLRHLADNGNPLHAAVVRTGSGVLDTYASGLDWEKKSALREREQRDSLRFFGLPEKHLTFLSLDNDDEGQMCVTPRNRELLAALIAVCAPDLLFLPHGNDTNSAHRSLCAMVREIVASLCRPMALFLIRDPKTVAMRTDFYTPFNSEEAAWKATLLRFHDTQHQRNLSTRGHGFDDRILAGNRQIARDLSLAAPYAEAFECEIYSACKA
jgi:LmbE family N-acetylglucosaminyl deacetylase